MPVEFDITAPIADPLEGLSEPIDKTVELEKKPDPPAPVTSPEVATKLQRIEQSVQGNELLTKVLSVPGVQDLLKAHQSGQPFKVLTGDEVKPSAPVEAPVDFDKLKDDPKALVEHLMSRITSELTPALEKSLATKLQPLVAKINEIDASVSSQTAQQVKSSMDDLTKKYPDIEQMKPLMAKLNNQVGGGLSLERLYQLAKLESGQPLVTQTQVETEKPTDNATRQPVNTLQKKYAPGRRGMKQAISDAVAGLDLESMLSQ